MNSTLMKLDEAITFIENNNHTPLAISGEESLLKQLPNGNWIGATIPYFIGEKGGFKSTEEILITKFPEASSSEIHVFNERTVGNIYDLEINNGFGFVLLPAASRAHHNFSVQTLDHDFFGKFPLIGWVAGIDLEKIGSKSPRVYNGFDGSNYDNAAVVLAVELPKNKFAGIETINIFEPDETSPTIEFIKDGFEATIARVDGKEVNFADYMMEQERNTQFPLVVDLCGARINTSFQSVEKGKVKFFAPVFSKTPYTFARPIEDYGKAYLSKVPEDPNAVFSCSCILNYLYARLEGKKTSHFCGPVTFGEIAYMLVNQTQVYLTINDL